jgi:ketosteroid isomerase-like protein
VDEHPSARLVPAFYEARARGDRAGIRRILAADIEWHDPHPPPHGGDLQGLETVLRDVFDGAAKLTGGSTRLWLEDVLANERRAVALYTIRDGQIAEARCFPFDRAAADAFFDAGPSG